MKLVINADDLGYTKAITDGIFRSHSKGVLTSTTLLMNASATEYAGTEAQNYPKLGIGVHLTLTAGFPLTNPKTLIQPGGAFLDQLTLRKTEVSETEVLKEWQAQIDRFEKLIGKKPTHLDSHHDVHFNPRFFEIAKALAEERGIPLRGADPRIPNVQNAFPDSESISPESFIQHLNKQQNYSGTELFCHPGFCDLELRQLSSYNEARKLELNVLINPVVQAYLADSQFELSTY
ncbi:ChbG/HpnK family deacetylase [Listeria valentina]|uniref:ChbG/HpnK family deacetylase n=1 Tax=Listeria valentina TaxID=2705293 RepID=UPI00142FE160|nr:ChbG/HpnK family deacetylase [Listeria valentina]